MIQNDPRNSRNRRFHTRLLTTVLALTLAATGMVWADEPSDEEERARVRAVVREQIRLCPRVQLGNGLQVLDMNSGGFLGVELTNLSPELRSHFGVPEDQGAMISHVVDDSAAAKAGLEVGDIIVGVDGETVGSSSELGRVVRQREGGEVVAVDYFRDGRLGQAQATLEESERCSVDVGELLEGIDWEEIGRVGEVALEGIDWEEIGESFAVSGEAWAEALENLQHTFDSQDWAEHFKGFENMDFDFDFEGLEERMEVLQERLEELERELERETDELDEELDRVRSREQEVENQAALELERVQAEIARAEATMLRQAAEAAEAADDL